MPRLLLDDELAVKIIEYDKKNKSVNEMARVTNGNIVLQDNIDKKYYLNYLNYLTGVSCVGLGTKAYTYHSFYEQAKQYSLDVITNTDDYDIILKHKWHLNYLEKIRDHNDNMPEMSETEMVEMTLRNNSNVVKQQNGA